MDVRVRFRFNKLSGEIEVFDVEQDSGLPSAEHEREHDRLAAEIGALLDRRPRVSEQVAGGSPGEQQTEAPQPPGAEAERDEDRRPRRRRS